MRRAFALLVVVTLAAAVWFAVSWRAEAPGGDEPPSTASPQAVPAAPDPVPRATIARAGRPGDPAAVVPGATTTAAVVGRVTAAGGESTSNAAVRLTPEGDEARAVVVRCGADGSFRADGLAPARWRVVVAGGGFATRLDVPGAEARFVDLRAGDEVRVDLEATPLAVVAGVVTDPDGRPVAGAAVKIHCDSFLAASGGWVLDATTGEDGRFERASVTPGEFVEVEVVRERFPRWTQWVRRVAAGRRTEIDVRLARGVPFDLVLTSEANGSPVAGALVWVSDAETQDLLSDDGIRSDPAGRVALVVADERAVRLQIDATDFVSVPARVVPAADVRAGPVTIALQPSLGIAGRVTYADGRVASGVELQAFPPGDPWGGRGNPHVDHSATADADGRFRFANLRPGRWVVAVVGSGWSPIHEVVVDAGASDVEIRLPEGAAPLREVRVRIVGAKGVAIDRVRHVDGVHVEGSLGSGGGGALAAPDVRISVARETDATSFFEAWDARDAAGAALPLGHVLLDIPDDVPGEWTVEMPPERFVGGRVVGADGRGVAAAKVQVASAVMDRALSELATAQSAADGTFRIGGLGGGEYVLTASAPGHLEASVVASGGAEGVEIRLATGTDVRVRVVDSDGAPVSGALVVAVRSDATDEHEDVPDFKAQPTDEAGRTVLPGLAPGVPHHLRVMVTVFGHEDGYFWLEKQRWIPADVEVRLERKLRIEGVVRRPDGSPFPGCVVTAEGEAASESRIETGPEPGAFTVRDLHAGAPVRLRATAGGVASEEVAVEPGRRDAVVGIDPGAWFALRLAEDERGGFDPSTGEAGVTVRWFPGTGSVRIGRDLRAVGGLDPHARYTIVAGPTPDGRCAEIRDVAADGRTVEIALAPGLPTGGRVTGSPATGASSAGAERSPRVQAVRDGVVVATARLSDDGTFRFPGLPAGRWTLRVVAGDSRAVIATAEAAAGDDDVKIAAGGR